MLASFAVGVIFGGIRSLASAEPSGALFVIWGILGIAGAAGLWLAAIEGPRSRVAAVLVGNGRFDFQAPIATAWKLHSLWPRSELVVVNDAGHAASNPGITEELLRATDRFARG